MKTVSEYYPVTSGQNEIKYEMPWNRNIDYKKNQQKTTTSLSILCHVALSVFNCDSHKCQDNIDQPTINWKKHSACKKNMLHVILSIL